MPLTLTNVADFLEWYRGESESTAKMLDTLTDESLKHPMMDGHRTLGRMAWHLVLTYPEMLGLIGIKIESPSGKDPIPATAGEIKQHYSACAKVLTEQVNQWQDSDLQKEDNMYGETWKRGASLSIFLMHEVHHRGQMTVVMRQAGLNVPGIYGPSRDEWKAFGMEPPAV
jgi:uncharacterized damage-inducible protein DinB